MNYTNGQEVLSHRELQGRLNASFPRGKPPVGWEKYVPPVSEPAIEDLLERQKHQVRQAAEAAYREPVTDTNSVTWNGGFDSALKVKGAVDMAEFAGRAQITLYDLDNAEHQVTLTEGKQVAATLGAVFQSKLAAKQAALRALSAIDLDARDARDQIAAVTFEAYYTS